MKSGQRVKLLRLHIANATPGDPRAVWGVVNVVNSTARIEPERDELPLPSVVRLRC